MTGQLAATAPIQQRGRRLLDRRGLVLVVLACVLLRIAMATRTSWAFDDFQARERLSGPLTLDALFSHHNGHLNPVGTLIQWLIQHGLPGHYVPLMVCSALLIGTAAILVGRWVESVYGPGWLPVLVAGFLGLSPMLIELSTWWSVAVYAAPMLAASSGLVWVTSNALRAERGWTPVLVVYVLCLLTFPKAILLPVLLIAIAAACPLLGEPLGLRGALWRWRALWLRLMMITAAYSVFYLVSDRDQGVSSPAATSVVSFMAEQTGEATLPALWGGPWQWIVQFGLLPVPLPVVLAAATLTVGVVAWSLVRVPSCRVLWVGWSTYLMISVLMTALARAGLSLAGPSLRYAFDMALPSAVALAVVVGGWPSVSRLRSRFWLSLAIAAWLTSTAVSYVHAWPKPMAVTQWSREVRTHFPQLGAGLLEQPMPSAFVLLPERLATYLTGEPGAPDEVEIVVDEFLGFDDQAALISHEVVGTPAVAPASFCEYSTRGGEVAIPLIQPLAPARHTVQVDYSLNASSTLSLGLGGVSTKGPAPAGDHRLFAVVSGEGRQLTVRVSNPLATLCVHGVLAGWPVPDREAPE